MGTAMSEFDLDVRISSVAGQSSVHVGVHPDSDTFPLTLDCGTNDSCGVCSAHNTCRTCDPNSGCCS